MFILTFCLQKTWKSRLIVTALRIRRQRRGVEDTWPAKVWPTPTSQRSFQKSSTPHTTSPKPCEVKLLISYIMWWLKNFFLSFHPLTMPIFAYALHMGSTTDRSSPSWRSSRSSSHRKLVNVALVNSPQVIVDKSLSLGDAKIHGGRIVWWTYVFFWKINVFTDTYNNSGWDGVYLFRSFWQTTMD